MRLCVRVPRLSSLSFVISIAIALFVGACVAKDPPATPEESCVSACALRAKKCSEDECRRGCNFSLDRIVEREMGTVLACMGKSGKCDDATWARCDVRVGPHVDGGPPAPPPPDDE